MYLWPWLLRCPHIYRFFFIVYIFIYTTRYYNVDFNNIYILYINTQCIKIFMYTLVTLHIYIHFTFFYTQRRYIIMNKCFRSNYIQYKYVKKKTKKTKMYIRFFLSYNKNLFKKFTKIINKNSVIANIYSQFHCILFI